MHQQYQTAVREDTPLKELRAMAAQGTYSNASQNADQIGPHRMPVPHALAAIEQSTSALLERIERIEAIVSGPPPAGNRAGDPVGGSIEDQVARILALNEQLHRVVYSLEQSLLSD